MPLFIQNTILSEAPSTVKEFHRAYSCFQDSAKQLTAKKPEEVGPVGLLYVGQREYGGTNPDDDAIKVIGSEDATTCHIGVLRHTGSGATSVLHFDGSSTEEGIIGMVQLVTELSQNKPEGRLEIHLVGGFEDERKNSEEVSLDLFECLVNYEANIHLMTACIGECNTEYKNGTPFPIIYGVAVEVETGRIFNAAFPDHGPDMPLRNAGHFTGGKHNHLVYNWRERHLTVGPYNYKAISNVDHLLSLPDSCYRKFMSTSPAQEPATFERDIRACLQFVKDHPDPMKTVFADNKPRLYSKMPDGKWQKL